MSSLAALPALADLALLVLRIVVGAMFALSGFFKLTDKDRGDKMRKSLVDAGVPAGLAPLLSLGELLGGISVLLGAVTVLGAGVLFVISAGALVLTQIPKAEGHGIHRIENILYSPEAILAAALLVLVAVGAGGWSLDALWWAVR